MLALKGQELQAFVVEASKVMSAAAESEEALSALEVGWHGRADQHSIAVPKYFWIVPIHLIENLVTNSTSL
jgi:hypothetical protein